MNKVLILGLVWPEPNSTAAGGRMLQIIRFFLDQGYVITFASTAITSTNSLDLNELGVQKETIQLNNPSFDTFVASLNPAIVVFDRFITEEQFGWRVAEQVPNALRILDTEDLHSLRAVRQQCFKSGSPFSIDAWLQHDKTKREVASIYRCDVSLIISTYELALLQDIVGIDPQILLYLPFLLDRIEKRTIANWPSFEERNDFIFIGNGKHDPNIDAIIWLKEEIWPKIGRVLPHAHLRVYGAYLPEYILQMNKPKDRIHVMGRIDDVQQVMLKAKVNLAPLRFGAGLKGKLIEGMQNGTPSITTGIGAEGMHGNLPWSGFIADKAEEFAQKAVLLFTDKQEWTAGQQNGVAIVNEWFNKKEFTKTFKIRIESVLENVSAHRAKNFIGSMLHYHTMASTKYLSRWISLKNE